MPFITFVSRLFVFCVLTVLTQVGGLVYVMHFAFYPLLNEHVRQRILRRVGKFACFLVLYALVSFVFVPPLAKRFSGRVPLPVRSHPTLRPLSPLTYLLNRHYVKSPLKQSLENVSAKLVKTYPDARLHYLDANFPFWDGFPLIPHLSHCDGKKVDVAFLYDDSKTGRPSLGVPSPIGYGICEEPYPYERNMPEECEEKGYWQYSLLKELVPQENKKAYVFNLARNAYLIRLMVEEQKVGKVFLEPHLKTRLGLDSEKVRFHGCRAVRHDDHIHLQLY